MTKQEKIKAVISEMNGAALRAAIDVYYAFEDKEKLLKKRELAGLLETAKSAGIRSISNKLDMPVFSDLDFMTEKSKKKFRDWYEKRKEAQIINVKTEKLDSKPKVINVKVVKPDSKPKIVNVNIVKGENSDTQK